MDPVQIPPGHALATFTRMPEFSLKITKRGKRCSLRRYELAFIPMPDVAHADRPRAFAYVDSDLSYKLGNVARSGCFTALVSNPRAQRIREPNA